MELALVLPLVFLLLLGVVQVGLLARDQVLLTHAAREAARQAAVGNAEGFSARALAAGSGLDPHRLRVDIRGVGRPSDTLEARLSYRAPMGVALIGRLAGDVTLRAKAAMRFEGVRSEDRS